MKTPDEIAGNLAWDGAVSPVLNKQPPCEWHNHLRQQIAAAIAAERQRADALAEALRTVERITTDGVSRSVAAAALSAYALAAYDAEAK